MNNLGRRLVDRECSEHHRVVTETCNDQPCPKWTLSEWSEVRTCSSDVTSNHADGVVAFENTEQAPVELSVVIWTFCMLRSLYLCA